MSPRTILICLALLVVVYAPLTTLAAPLELSSLALHAATVDSEVAEASEAPPSDSGNPQKRTFFLLLPLLFPDTFYFT